MPDTASTLDVPIRDRRQLVEWMAAGSKPKSAWRVGTEHEKFGFRRADLRPPAYHGEDGIGAVLEGLAAVGGWRRIEEQGLLIALERDGASISLEPAGQLELSGAPLTHLHETCSEVYEHLAEMRRVADPLGLAFLGMGFQPKWRREDMPWMPKARYQIMRDYMPKVGQLGLDMMSRTCTIQANLDFGDEADMVKKFRVGLALQPIITAIFADSPFTEGRPNGLLSWRAHVWSDTDPQRTGGLDFVFDEGFGFEAYVDWLVDQVPMYFVYRDGRYLDVAGQSFADFMAGRLPGLPGELPSLRDFTDHATTAFPDVRLKRYLEVRGADGGPWNRICALPALWVGLYYDSVALDGAWDLVRDWTTEDRARLRAEVPGRALGATIAGRTVAEIAADLLALSARGLAGRGYCNASGADERIFLEPLVEHLHRGVTPAELKLERFHTVWGGSIDPLFHEYAY